MSQTIDTKVVEMKFDNSDFETNVKKSQSTLEKLKQDLDMTKSAESFKNVTNAAKDVSFDGMIKGLNDSKDHFDGLEKIASGFFKKIGERAEELGEKITKSLTIEMPMAGWNQYEEKTKSVQTIMNATGQDIETVNASLDKLMWFADETSYSFSDMTNNIGKFTSMGIDLEDSTSAMMGISNWAAQSGAGINEASRAMYNLSQAMGVGAVKLQDWKSIENANMATAEFKQQVIDTAKQMGVLDESSDVTLSNFSSSLKDEWFTADVLLEVLKDYSAYSDAVYERIQETGEACSDAMAYVSEYGDSFSETAEKAFKAAQEAKTFTDAVEAMRDAVKTQFATLFEGVFGNYEEAKVTWTNFANSLWDLFASPIADINEQFQEALKAPSINSLDWLGVRDEIRNTVGLTDDELKEFENAIKRTAEANGIDVDAMIAKWGSFGASLQEGWLNNDIIEEALSETVTTTEDALSEIQDLVDKIWAGELGNGEERKKAIEELGYDFEEIQKLVEKGAGAELNVDDLTESMLEAVGATESEADALRKIKEALDNGDLDVTNELMSQLSGAEIRNAFWDNLFNDETGAIVTYTGAFREALSNVFGSIDSGGIREILEKLYEFSENLLNEDRVNRFKTRLEKLFRVIHTIFEAVKGVWGIVKQVLGSTIVPVIKGVLDAIMSIADGVGGLIAKFDEGGTLGEWFANVIEKIGNVLKPVKQTIEVVFSALSNFINALFRGQSVGTAFKEAMYQVFTMLDPENGRETFQKFSEYFDQVKEIGKQIGDTFTNIGSKIKEAWGIFQNTELGQSISNFAEKIKDNLSKAFGSVRDWVKGLFSSDEGDSESSFNFLNSIQNILTRFNDWLNSLDLESMMTGISDFVMGAVDDVKKAFEFLRNTATSIAEWFEGTAVFKFISDSIKNIRDTLFGSDQGDTEGSSPFLTKLSNFFEKIKEIFRSIVDWFTTNKYAVYITSKFKEIIEALFGDQSENGEAEQDVPFATRIHNAFEIIKGVFNDIANWFNNNSVVKFVIDKFQSLKGVFNEVVDWLKNNAVVQFLIDKFEDLKATLMADKGGGGDDEPFITKILNSIKTAADWFVQNSDNIFGTIKDLLGAGALGSIILLIKKIRGFIQGGLNLPEKIGKILGGVSKALNAFAFKELSIGVVLFALAIDMVAAALIGLTLVDANKLSNVGLTLGIVAGGFGLLAVGISDLMTAIGQKKNATNKTNAEIQSLQQITDSKTGLLNGLTGIANSISNFVDNIGTAMAQSMKIKSYAALIISLAVAIGVLSYAVFQLAKLDLEKLAQGLGTVVILIGSLTAAMKLMTAGNTSSFSITKAGLSSSSTGKASSGFALLGMAFAILILVRAIDQICEYNLEELIKGMGTIGVLLLEVSIATRIMSKTTTFGNAASLIATAISMLLFVKTIDKLRDFNMEELLQGILGLGAILLEVGIFTRLMSSNVTFGQGIGLAAIAGSILIFVEAVKKLSEIRSDQLGAGIGALAGILAGIAGFVWVIDAVSSSTKGLSLVLFGIAGVIGSVAAAIWVVSDAIKNGVNLDQIGAQLGNLISGLVEGLISAITNSADSIIQGILSLISSLATYAPQIVDTLVTLVINVLDALTARLPELATSLANFAGAVMESFAEAFKGVDLTSLVTVINELLFATASLVLIGKFGSIGTVAKGLVELAEVIAAFGLIIAAFGALSMIEGFDEFMARGADSLVIIADGIGSFFGALIGGFLGTAIETFASSFPAVATYLSDFMTNIQPFVESASKIDDSFPAAVGNLVEAMLMIAGGSFVDTLVNGLTALLGGGTNGTVNYIGKFKELGEGIVAFADTIKDVDFSAVEGATSAAKVLQALIDVVPKEGGLWQKIVGQQDFSKVEETFTGLGKGVAGFCGAIQGVTVDESTATSAANAISTLMAIVPNENGLWQKIVGQQDFSKVEETFTGLGKGVAGFCNAIADCSVDEGTVTTAANSISTLMAIVPNENGMWQDIVGQQDFTNVETTFTNLGKGVAGFCKAIEGVTIDEGTVTSAATGIKALMDVVPNENGILQDIVGHKDYTKVEETFTNLGKGVAGFCKAIEGVTIDSGTTTAAATAISTLADIIPTEGGILQKVTGTQDFTKAESTFTNLGKGVAGFCKAIEGVTIDEGAATSAANVIDILVKSTPSTGGLWQDIVGEKDLGKFGDNLGILGTGVSAFVGATQNVTKTMVERAKIASNGMIDVINLEWPKSGGLVGLVSEGWGGSTDFSAISGKFEEIGTMAQTLCSSFNDVDITSAENAKSAAQAIIDILSMEWPAEATGFAGWISKDVWGGANEGEINWNDIADVIGSVVGVAKSLSPLMEEVKVENIQNIKPVAESIKEIIDSIKDIDDSSDADAFKAAAGSIKDAISDFGKDISGLNTVAIALAVGSISLLITTLKTMSETNFTGAEGFSTALGTLADTGITKFEQAFTDSVEKVKSTVNKFIDDIVKALKVPKDFEDAGSKDGENFNSGLDDWSDDVKKTSDTMVKDAIDALTQEKKFEDSGSTDGKGFHSGFLSWQEQIKKTISDLIENMLKNLKHEMSFKSVGSDDGKGFYEGFSSWHNSTATYVSNLKTEIIGVLDDAGGFNNVGGNDGNGFYDGLAAWHDNINFAAQTLRDGAKSELDDYIGFYNTGAHVAEGFYWGLDAWLANIKDKAAQLVRDAKNAADQEADSHSPSREMFKRGEWFAMGWNNGITSMTNETIATSANMVRKSIEVADSALRQIDFKGGISTAVGSALSDIRSASYLVLKHIDPNSDLAEWFHKDYTGTILSLSKSVAERTAELAKNSTSIIQSGFNQMDFNVPDSDPVITPVMDLTKIQNAASQLDEMLDTEPTVNLDVEAISRLASSVGELDSEYNINSTYDDSNVVKKIDDLGNKIGALNDSIGNMNLYLDGRTLVGGIAPDMDKALGALSAKKNKGVI